jgi:O-antigen/teichoic acid export membrane protein
MKSRSKGIALSYVYLIINMLCGLFLSSYLIKQLGKTEYGVYQTIASFANYLVLLEFGTGTVMTRNISVWRGTSESKHKLNENVSTIWTITNILALIILIASAIMYFSIDSVYSKSLDVENLAKAKGIFVVVTVNLVISFYAQSFTGLTLAFEKYSYGPILKTSKTIIRTILLGVLLLKFKYAIIIAIIDTILSIATLIVSYIYCKKNFDLSFRFKYFNSQIFRSVLPLSIALFLQTLINQANNSVDKFLIGIMISPEAVTLYSIPLFIFNIFSSICVVPVNMYAPQIAKEIGGGAKPSDLMDKFISAAKLTAIVGGSIFFGFIASGKPFISLVYDKEYMDAWIIAILLIFPHFLDMLLGTLVNVLDVLGKRLVSTLALAGTTTANIVFTIIMINFWGYMGAAFATLVCTSGNLIFLIYYYSKKIKIDVFKIFAECFTKVIPAQIVATVAGYAVTCLIGYESKIISLVSLLAGGSVYVAIFVAFLFVINKEESMKLISLFKNKLLKR